MPCKEKGTAYGKGDPASWSSNHLRRATKTYKCNFKGCNERIIPGDYYYHWNTHGYPVRVHASHRFNYQRGFNMAFEKFELDEQTWYKHDAYTTQSRADQEVKKLRREGWSARVTWIPYAEFPFLVHKRKKKNW